MILTLDYKDIVNVITGFLFLMLTILAFLKGFQILSAPIFFIIMGAFLAYLPLDLPFLNIQSSHFQMKVFEHFTEIIVIISLAGAGLAIDRPIG